MAKTANTKDNAAELKAALKEKDELQTRVTVMEGQLEEAAANAQNVDELKDRIAELEGQLEAAATGAGGGDEALMDDYAALKAENAKLKAQIKAAPEGSIATDGGKEARGEEVSAEKPDWKKPDYDGSLTAEQAVWRLENIYHKEVDEVETK